MPSQAKHILLIPPQRAISTKGLPHNNVGIVDPLAYDALVAAATGGNSTKFDLVPLGGVIPLANPQAGLTFCLEGLDSHQFKLPPAPAFASAERAGEAVECYWMALLRDVNFSDYQTDPLAACDELSRLTDFRGPRENGKVTPTTLFFVASLLATELVPIYRNFYCSRSITARFH
jgi:hypothetical protein